MLTISPKDIAIPQLHQYLLGAVAPRPIAFASTLNPDGTPNLAPFSFFNVFSVNPPIAIFSPARRGKNNTTKHTYENALTHPECVINIVNYAMVQQMSVASGEYERGVNEFVKSGLTPIDSLKVKPPRVKESPIQLECRINDVIALGDKGGAGNLIVCEVLLIHIDEKVLDSSGRIDPALLDQVARMGGHWYSRAREGLFQLPQPTTNVGIGFDRIPPSIRNSQVLSANNLGQLASAEQLPDETSVNEYKLTELAELFLSLQDSPQKLETALHQRARQLLDEGKIAEAWQCLLAFNG